MPTIADSLDAILADPAITRAAERVARAKAAVAERTRETGQARETVQQLAARIAAIDAYRAEIADRRKRGERHDGDVGALDAIAIDREGLVELKAEADAKLDGFQREEDATRRELGEATEALVYAETAAAFVALNAHAEHLLDLLSRTMVQATEAGKRLEGQAALTPLMKRTDRLGVILGEAIGQLGEAGRRVGATEFRWVPNGDLMDQLRETIIRGRPK